MTTITFFQRKDSAILGFEAKDHAGYAQSGEDIVCSAISALTQATEYGLTYVVNIPIDRKMNESKATYSVMLKAQVDEALFDKAQILLQTLLGSLKSIEEDYARFIRVTLKERR